MTTHSRPEDGDTAAAAAAEIPGSLPPTGGVPPEDAAPARGNAADERSAAEDLVDGIDLMLRAARKALRSVDPEIEAAAQRAVTRLQELDARTVEPIRKHMASIDTGRIDRLASDVGREMAGFVERIAHRIESEIDASRK